MVRDGSRFIASVVPTAEFGPELLTVATQAMAVPVVAVAGAVSETEMSPGEEEISFTSGDWKM